MPKTPRKTPAASLKSPAAKKRATKTVPNKPLPNKSRVRKRNTMAPRTLVTGRVERDVIEALLPNETTKKKFGGAQEGAGRKPNKLRELLAHRGELHVERLEKGLRKIRNPVKKQMAMQRYVDLCFKYGIGTTITQTRGDGTDVIPPGMLTVEEQRELMLKLLGSAKPNEET